MVKKIIKFFAYLSFFILAIIYFAPKISLYYLLESKIKPLDVVVTSEVLKDNGFSLNIKDATVIVKSIESAKIKELDIKLIGFYNRIDVYNIMLSSTAKSFIPLQVEKINILHHLFKPLDINLFVKGGFGEANINVNILERKLHLKLFPSKLMKQKYKNSLLHFKKSENGELTYDKTF
ncbi:MAG: hypothetical protein U9P72_10390 [Campylobacterota bacterium]|nr:hypothetical protein [Campylobacterota bacterium]